MTGAFGKNPARLLSRINEPKPAPIGPAPSWLTAAERETYRHLVRCAAPGQLGATDSSFLAVVARTLQKIKAGSCDPKLFAEFRQQCTQLGFTPSARSRVQAMPPEETHDAKDPIQSATDLLGG